MKKMRECHACRKMLIRDRPSNKYRIYCSLDCKNSCPDFAAKISKARTGTKLSEEHKRHIGEAGIGRFRTDNPAHPTIHQWLRRNFGDADHCDICGRTETPKLKTRGKPLKGTKNYFEWSNKDHFYTRDLSKWWQLCRKCHYHYDKDFVAKILGVTQAVAQNVKNRLAGNLSKINGVAVADIAKVNGQHI